jgi:hypothetical protein
MGTTLRCRAKQTFEAVPENRAVPNAAPQKGSKPFAGAVATALGLMMVVLTSPSNAQAQSVLGTAQTFGVLGASTVTNTGPSSIDGNVGVYAGSAITGFPPGMVVPPYSLHVTDAVAQQAQADNTTAYNALSEAPVTANLTGQDLGTLTSPLIPGVYAFNSSAMLTGNLTLDAQNDPNATWIFQINSTLTTASASSVTFVNGNVNTSGGNVFWLVGSSATLGSATSFTGNILALTSITLNTTAIINCGRALAQTGAVTLDSNTIIIPGEGDCVVTTPELPPEVAVAEGILSAISSTNPSNPVLLGVPQDEAVGYKNVPANEYWVGR